MDECAVLPVLFRLPLRCLFRIRTSKNIRLFKQRERVQTLKSFKSRHPTPSCFFFYFLRFSMRKSKRQIERNKKGTDPGMRVFFQMMNQARAEKLPKEKENKKTEPEKRKRKRKLKCEERPSKTNWETKFGKFHFRESQYYFYTRLFHKTENEKHWRAKGGDV